MIKNIIMTICLTLGVNQISNAQIAFGIKGGLNYNTNSIKEVESDVFEGAKNKTGYHGGIWLRAKLPIVGFYIRPELVYTHLTNEIVYKTSGNTTSYNFQKIDIPVLLGKKVFGVGTVFAGPSFQYILQSNFSFDDISHVKADGFTAGIQLGAGVELGKLGVDVRWERAFSDIESNFVDRTNNNDINFDTRINQIIIGISYKL